MGRKVTKIPKMIRVCILLCILCMIPASGAQAASAKTKALKAYNKMLSLKNINWTQGEGGYYGVPAKNCKFAIAYIDGDSIPELIVYSKDAPYVSGAGRVYTYKKGQVKVLQKVWFEDGFYYYKKKGVFVSTQMNMGWNLWNYYKISGTKANFKLARREQPYWGTIEYLAESDLVTKSQFNQKLKKLVGNTKRTKVKLYKNTAKNRKQRLK